MVVFIVNNEGILKFKFTYIYIYIYIYGGESLYKCHKTTSNNKTSQ